MTETTDPPVTTREHDPAAEVVDICRDLIRIDTTNFGDGSGPGERKAAEHVAAPLDPTGCGDVWGATYFSRLLAGDNLGDAIRAAHRAAARNVEHRGASGLADHLRGKLSFT